MNLMMDDIREVLQLLKNLPVVEDFVLFYHPDDEDLLKRLLTEQFGVVEEQPLGFHHKMLGEIELWRTPFAKRGFLTPFPKPKPFRFSPILRYETTESKGVTNANS